MIKTATGWKPKGDDSPSVGTKAKEASEKNNKKNEEGKLTREKMKEDIIDYAKKLDA